MICICGLPASGKSTLLAELVTRVSDARSVYFDNFLAEGSYYNARRRFYEEIALQLQIMTNFAFSVGAQEQNCPSSAYDKLQNPENEAGSVAYRLLLEVGEKAKLGYWPPNYVQIPTHLLFVEHTFYHRSARKLASRLAEFSGMQCIFLHLDIPECVCRERNRWRDNLVQGKSFENVAKQFDAFSDEENVLTVFEGQKCDEVLYKARERLAACKIYVSPKNQTAAEPYKDDSALHLFDLESRKLVNELLKVKEHRGAAQQANKLRKQALECYKATSIFNRDAAVFELRQRLENLVKHYF